LISSKPKNQVVFLVLTYCGHKMMKGIVFK